MTAYFDNNIYIYIEENTLSVKKIQERIGIDFKTIYYSSAHVQETLERQAESEELRNERINTRLQIIQDITQNNYLNEGLDDVLIKSIESPFSVLQTITEVSFVQDNMKNLVNMVNEDKKQKARDSLSFDPLYLNNIDAASIVYEIDKKLMEHNYTFQKFVDLGIEQSNLKNNFYNKTMVAFELLDLFGFYKDKYTTKSNYARLWDAIHTYYASYCNYFVTNDKNTIQKASVIYYLNNIGTKIISGNIR